MSHKKASLAELPPEPVDEQTPLLSDANGRPTEQNALEAQAEQEQREYDTAHVPLPEEPSTKKLLFIMGSLWITTFFAALGIIQTGILNTAPS